MRAVDYSQYGATTLAAESLRAQLPSQCKLTTPRHKNRKIQHENELLNAKEPTPDVQKCQIYRMTLKNIPQNLVRLSL
jgi:hypothetical protein